jgi:hypothetical protein
MSKFDSDTQRIFRERVKVQTSDLKYVEFGDDYVRLKDPVTGKVFEIKVKEKK